MIVSLSIRTIAWSAVVKSYISSPRERAEMRKGESKFKTNCSNQDQVPQAIFFYEEEFVQTWYPPEVFLPITDREVPGIQPYYLISNFGRIWHIYERRFLSKNLDSKGYWMKPFALRNGKQKICRIHRVLMLVFCWIPDHEKMEVNHKDGDKQNCILWNLEWVTPSENNIHAIKMGLSTGGKKKITDEQIHNVCRLLEEAELTLPAIAEKVGTTYSIVAAIQRRAVHTQISDQYHFTGRKKVSNLTTDQVNKICQYFEKYKPKPEDWTYEQYFIDALKTIGAEVTTLTVRTVQKIYWKETYWYISKNYNF